MENNKIKVKRSLSGIYFRYKNPETGKFENRTFEDLPEETMDEIMKDRDIEWVKSLAKKLADTLSGIGNHFDITLENEVN